ncbi:inactive glutathione S-transferase D3-like [Pararge aegeria]|uniref:Jg25215 protein n=2 Tax=Pararge aegeria TaxID=116150 RepID=A0A8S4RUV9_9NEOP|nr:inactive glutathione S-transferase D3-like [Pararge aegeria]CAH2242301.1 jg25215 [Pararge aegeria aegeria]
MSTSTIKLYHFSVSSPSRGALLAARVIGVPVEIVIIDLMKKEQLNESFIKINPQHCIPTLDDNGFVIWESRAIACYLADKYGKDAIYPKDLQRRAVVNQRLYFDSSFLYPRIRAICYPIIFEGVTEIKDKLKDELNNSLDFLNQFLDGNKWVAGDHVTVADTAIIASLTSILEVGWDISNFSNIQRWLKDCASLPGYEENLEGAKSFGSIVKKNLKQ